MVGQKPELVLAQYHWHIGPQGEVGTREQFASLGIKTWISPADCTDKTVTATSNADGARSTPFSLAEIKHEVTDLAAIFDVPARGEQLNRELTERIQKAQARISAKPLKVVFLVFKQPPEWRSLGGRELRRAWLDKPHAGVKERY
ncbi:iron complex transport system substrate-binding protein [Enterobacter cloacae]|uniref:Iron complex transport system substrate-binding protein n=1 Tax=Enterobacter cloacae TaxID=550 RepID=A0A377M4H2_ENTCL|nr:iron complex transport system substrate-binding protein [Enterobacter cloacae]